MPRLSSQDSIFIMFGKTQVSLLIFMMRIISYPPLKMLLPWFTIYRKNYWRVIIIALTISQTLEFKLGHPLAITWTRFILSCKNQGLFEFLRLQTDWQRDMVAFSCCVYDGGERERSELEKIREKGWTKFMQKDRVFAPGLNRVRGLCPMTPVEVGMMLRGMGFSNNTPIYLASGSIYREDKYLEPLQRMFPLLHTKDTLATVDELSAIQGYSSRLAALDYMVCLSSEVFVTTQGVGILLRMKWRRCWVKAIARA